MDPNQTYIDMYQAMKAGEFETARELALALKDWFAKGGFTPHQYTPEVMHAYIASVLCRTSGHGSEPPFTLVCRHCDAGEGIDTEEQAIGEGWSEIEPAYALPQANYCDVCPECKTLDD